ncbi:MAG: hypothetical protein GXC76_02310 [Rhodanobacteraceae bacterium]|jgi:hypothetical protein|nr:hypothetical protein [Rhodanobacteraceae bacterium]
MNASPWPPLPLAEWRDTYATLHMWTQIVGKTRLAFAPMQNHWWQVTLYVTPRGLSTSAAPCGTRSFEIAFDLIEHRLSIQASDGCAEAFALAPMTVAEFFARYLAALRRLGIVPRLMATPVEIETAIPFADDRTHAAYDAAAARRCWQVLVQVERVLQRFRGRYLGKQSPAHFFWGSFDLAATRFCGRRAPRHPGGAPNCPDYVMVEAYSHECASCGFWPGGGAVAEPVFYAYAYPEPPGFAAHPVRPAASAYDARMREFLLPYEAVRAAAEPDRMLLEFLQSTYEACAELAHWDRAAIERPPSEWP